MGIADERPIRVATETTSEQQPSADIRQDYMESTDGEDRC
jgi:hypothetical protein